MYNYLIAGFVDAAYGPIHHFSIESIKPFILSFWMQRKLEWQRERENKGEIKAYDNSAICFGDNGFPMS